MTTTDSARTDRALALLEACETIDAVCARAVYRRNPAGALILDWRWIGRWIRGWNEAANFTDGSLTDALVQISARMRERQL